MLPLSFKPFPLVKRQAPEPDRRSLSFWGMLYYPPPGTRVLWQNGHFPRRDVPHSHAARISSRLAVFAVAARDSTSVIERPRERLRLTVPLAGHFGDTGADAKKTSVGQDIYLASPDQACASEIDRAEPCHGVF